MNQKGRTNTKIKQEKHNLSPPAYPAFVCCFMETFYRKESYQKYLQIPTQKCVSKEVYILLPKALRRQNNLLLFKNITATKNEKNPNQTATTTTQKILACCLHKRDKF